MIFSLRTVVLAVAAIASSAPVAAQPCDISLEYAIAKATGLNALNVNNATSATSLGQWFDAPGTVSVSGATFYAFVSGSPVTVDVSVFLADAGGLPTGAALATTSIVVSNGVGGGTLSELAQPVTFPTAAVVSAPYVVVATNDSATSVAVVTNAWNAVPPDGGGEYLASAQLGPNWVPSAAVNVGGLPFDADFVIEPIVSFDATPAFTSDMACVNGPQNVTFTNQSAFALSRFYNQAAFDGTPETSFTWDYGDGSPTENAVSPTHAYVVGGPHTVQLTSTVGWTCTRTEMTSAVLSGAGVFTTNGVGCPSAAPLALSVDGLPTIGQTMTLTCSNVPGTAMSVALLMGEPPSQSVPLDVIGAIGCTLYLDNLFYSGAMVLGISEATMSFPFPNVPESAGGVVDFQAAALDMTINALGVVLSDHGSMTLGGC